MATINTATKSGTPIATTPVISAALSGPVASYPLSYPAAYAAPLESYGGLYGAPMHYADASYASMPAYGMPMMSHGAYPMMSYVVPSQHTNLQPMYSGTFVAPTPACASSNACATGAKPTLQKKCC